METIKKEKLELKHLAPYHEHRVKLTDRLRNKYNISYLSTKSIAFIDVKGYGDVQKLSWENASGKIKPILRHLSDLTKEIEHKGEKFVPILEIGTEFFADMEKYVNEDDGSISYGWDEYHIDDSQGYEFSYSSEHMCFGVWYDSKEENESPLYQVGGYKEMQKLFEWHFDVFGLIEKGLAIDINTINQPE
jgi:hypothetical protein